MAVIAKWRLGAQRATRDGAVADVGEADASADTVVAPPSSRLRTVAAQTGVSALILGVLLHLRDGYHAGSGEQLTLSVPGLHWARSDWFAGDWAIGAVPRPSLTFDVITWFGGIIASPATIYLIFWLAALLTFGAATTLLARSWLPQRAWLAVISVPALAGLTPIDVVGVVSPFRAVAAPSVLGGALLYLAVAALLVGRHRLAAVAVVAAAVIDLPSGLAGLVVLVAVGVLARRRDGHLDRTLAGAAGGVAVVIGLSVLVLPAFAGPGDLARACQTVLAERCDAATWHASELRIGVATLALALLTRWLMPRELRWRFLPVVAVPFVLALGALGVQYVGLPVLTSLVQGVFLQGVAVVLFGLVAWGVLTPFLAEATSRTRWLLTTTVLLLGLCVTEVVRGVGTDRGHWAFDPNLDQLRPPWVAMMGAALILGTAVLTVPEFRLERERVTRWATAALVLVALVCASFGQLALRPFDPGFGVGNADLAAWGAQVEQVVPPGATIVVPPASTVLRMATKRAVLVDCAYQPYGGQARTDFTERIEAIGGVGQCDEAPRLTAYGHATTADLTAAATRFGARYLIVDATATWRIDELTAAGWSVLVPPRGGATFTLLSAP